MTIGIDPTQRAAANIETRALRVAYTPDSDDAFNYYAWQHGRLRLNGFDATFEHGHIVALNRRAVADDVDVVGISSAFYPVVADRFWILSVGASVGRGYGPVLVARGVKSPTELRGKRIGVGGAQTTGAALALMYCTGATLIEMPYDRIADAIVAGAVDAGVMIHEELLYFPEKGLTRVCDLGAAWSEDTTLPLPVGLNIVNKRLGYEAARRIADACVRSLRWALANFDEAFAYASQFGRGCAQQHIAMFSNEDTACLPADVRAALPIMFRRVADLGLAPRIGAYEIIDP